MTDSTRVNETIAFINNYANVTPVQRQTAAQFCRQQYPKLKLLDFGPYKNEFHTLSSAMSVKQHTTVPAGSHADRAKRRAIFLIWTSFEKAYPGHSAARAHAAMTMPTGNLDAALAAAIKKASVYATPGGAADVFNEVFTDTRKFLTAHKVIVWGATAGDDKFKNLLSPTYTNVLTFYFQYDVTTDRFVFGRQAGPMNGAAHSFQTVSVPGIAWQDVPNVGAAPGNFAQILGCELTGATFMLTTQFTGCTFCWTTHGGIVRAAHIGPVRKGRDDDPANPTIPYPGGGNAAATRIVAQGAAAGMANAGGPANAGGAALHVFGRGAGNAPVAAGNPFYPSATLEYGTIIGRNNGAGWKFYLQAIDSGPLKQISEARRIH